MDRRRDRPEDTGEPAPSGAREETDDRDISQHPGVTEVDAVVREDLASYIDSAPYPTDRTQLLETAREHGAPDHWLTILEFLPPDYRFHSVDEVAASLGYGYRTRPS